MRATMFWTMVCHYAASDDYITVDEGAREYNGMIVRMVPEPFVTKHLFIPSSPEMSRMLELFDETPYEDEDSQIYYFGVEGEVDPVAWDWALDNCPGARVL